MAVFAAIDVKTLDEGASSLGASPWRRFRDVIVPNARPGILAGSLMVVTLSLGEFNLTWMLHTPLTKTLPVGLADSYASMRLEVASAYTLVFFVMIIPLLTAMQIFAGYRSGPIGDAVMSDQQTGQSSRADGARRRARHRELRQDLCRRHARARTGDAPRRARRDLGAARPVRLRQDHAACASSPGSRHPTPAADFCSTTPT